MIPDFITGKICKAAVDSQHRDADGSMPKCYGVLCTCFNACNVSELNAMVESEKLARTAIGRGVIQRLQGSRK